MREQKGYVFHKDKSWFVRYCDDVLQPDGIVKRVQVCEKLKEAAYGGEYRTKKSVAKFVEEDARPINAGELDVRSTMQVSDFVESVYLPKFVEKTKAAATLKQYKTVWINHLKPRMGTLTLRGFRTLHGEQMFAEDC